MTEKFSALRSNNVHEIEDELFQVVHSSALFQRSFQRNSFTRYYEFVEPKFDDEKGKLKNDIINYRMNIIQKEIEKVKSSKKFCHYTLIKFQDDEYVFIFQVSELFIDQTSMKLLMKYLYRVYNGKFYQIKDVSVQDFIEKRNENVLNKSEIVEYWKNLLNDANFHFEFKLPKNIESKENDSVVYPLNGQPVIRFAKKKKIKIYDAMLFLFSSFICKYFRRGEVVVLCQKSVRMKGFENAVGQCSSYFLMKGKFNKDSTLKKNFQDFCLSRQEMKGFDECAFSKIIRIIRKENPSFNPNTINIGFSENILDIKTNSKDGIRFEILYPVCSRRFDLEMEFHCSNSKKLIFVRIIFKRSLFDRNFIKRFVKSFHQYWIDYFSSKESTLFRDIDVVSGEEKKILIEDFNNRKLSLEVDKTIPEIFQERLTKYESKTALEFRDETMNYKEMNEKVNQIAHYLRSKFHVKQDEFVGMCIDKSIELMLCVYGILKSGSAYFPIDNGLPPERARFMIEDTKCKVMFVSKKNYDVFKEIFTDLSIIYVEDLEKEVFSKMPIDNPVVVTKPDNIAYVIFTSGSTGKPKGVVIEHRNVINFIESQWIVIDLTEDDKYSNFASVIFDASVSDFFTPLFHGMVLSIIPENLRKDADNLFRYLEEKQIAAIDIPPILLKLFPRQKPKYLKTLIIGGDTCDYESMKFWSDNVKTFINSYGPTECCVVSHEKLWKSGDKQTNIGTTLSNVTNYVLNSDLQLVPIGCCGELCIGGHQVARGYLNRPKLTKDRFIENPFKKGERLYRTGDLCKLTDEGEIIFVGRVDFQVKIRGFRIELEEIEDHLFKMEKVKDAKCLVKVDHLKNKRLIAFIVPSVFVSPIDKDLKEDLKEYLARRVPSYMIPTVFVFLEKFPLNLSGKVERKKLLAIDLTQYIKREVILPSNELEIEISRIWREMLNLPDISISDNVFELGANSLLIIKAYNQLSTNVKSILTVADFYVYPSIQSICNFYSSKTSKKALPKVIVANKIQDLEIVEDFAIIGVSCRLPGSDNIEEFWDLLVNKKIAAEFTEMANQKDENFVNVKYSMKDIKSFDHNFFGISKALAQITDPQFRIFLQLCYQCLESSGYCVTKSNSKLIGLFCGVGDSYYINNVMNNFQNVTYKDEYMVKVMNSFHIFSGYVAYYLGIEGPCISVNTACSSSLVAVKVACNSITNRECKMALAGGVSIPNLDKSGYYFKEGSIFSRDGYVRTFDEKASGTVLGSGGGVILIKSLKNAIEEKDHIYGIIKGSALKNDGNLIDRQNLFAPSIESQTDVIVSAIENSGISPERIVFVEAHGTGTSLGDVVELSALKMAWKRYTNKREICYLGSSKQNIGHLDSCAGIAGLIKTMLVLYHSIIPGLPLLQNPSKYLGIENSPFILNKENIVLSKTKKISAACSSFGLGGQSCHFVLEKYISNQNEDEKVKEMGVNKDYLLIFSAHSINSFDKMMENYKQFFEKFSSDVDIENVEYTLCLGRDDLKLRRFLTCKSLNEAVGKIKNKNYTTFDKRKGECEIVFAFPGQGSQYLSMTLDLYEKNEVYRCQVNTCLDLIKNDCCVDLYPFFKREISKEIEKNINETEFSQLLLLTVEYSMAKLLMFLGIKPSFLIGHSFGELVCGVVSNVFTFENAVKIVRKRGQLLQKMKRGKMISVSSSKDDLVVLVDYLNLQKGANLEFSVFNSPKNIVLSGNEESITILKEKLVEKKIECRILKTSHAFHSTSVSSAAKEFAVFLKTIKLNGNEIPYISNVTGNLVKEKEVTDPKFWGKHIRKACLFSKGVETLLSMRKKLIFIEVGPMNILSKLIRNHSINKNLHFVVNSVRHPKLKKDDMEFFLNRIGEMWSFGCDIHWNNYFGKKKHRIPLPVYPFERKYCWIDDDVGKSKKTKQKFLNFEEVEKNFVNLLNELNGKFKRIKKSEVKTIFVTGSTGFVGYHFIKTIKESTNFAVYNLVRKKKEENVDDEKIRFVEGDLGKMNFGLTDKEFEDLSTKIDVIVHLGALLDRSLTYDEMFEVNVKSLFELVKLAKGYKPIIFFSSLAVYSKLPKPNDHKNIKNMKHRVLDGYGCSKYVVDTLLDKHYKNCFIFRCTHITGSVKTGRLAVPFDEDFLTCVMKFTMDEKIIPILPQKQSFNFVTVDYCVEAIISLLKKRMYGDFPKVYILSFRDFSMNHLFTHLEKLLKEGNHNFVKISMDNWLNELNSKLDSSYIVLMIKNLFKGANNQSLMKFDFNNDEVIKLMKNSTKSMFENGKDTIINFDNVKLFVKFIEINDAKVPTEGQKTKDKGVGLMNIEKIQEIVCETWQELMELDRIEIYQNFFEIGGDSLIASIAVSKLSVIFQIKVTVKDLFSSQSVLELSKKILKVLGENNNVPKVYHQLVKYPRPPLLPLSKGEESLFLADFFSEGNKDIFYLPFAFTITSNNERKIDPVVIERAIRLVIQRHESLRSNFRYIGKSLYRWINKEDNFNLRIYGFKDLSNESPDKFIRNLIDEDLKTDFDIENGQLIRSFIVMLSDTKAILYINVHHMVFDFHSLKLFIDEMMKFCEMIVRGEKVDINSLPAVQYQYADYAIWNEKFLTEPFIQEQREFWRRKLFQVSGIVNFPVDNEVSSDNSGKVYSFKLSGKLHKKIVELSKKNHVTMFVVFLSIYQILLYNYTNQNKIAVGIFFGNRGIPNVEKIIGYFVNVIPFVLDCESLSDITFVELLKNVEREYFEACNNQDLPYEDLVNYLKNDRKSPIYSVSFNYLDFASRGDKKKLMKSNNFKLETYPFEINSVQDVLGLEVVEENKGLEVFFEYSNTFNIDTIKQMSTHFIEIINEITENEKFKIGNLCVLTEEQFLTQTQKWGRNTDIKRGLKPYEDSVIEIFFKISKALPEKLSIVCGERKINYQELELKVKQIANYLQKEHEKYLEEIGVFGVFLDDYFDIIPLAFAVIQIGGILLVFDDNDSITGTKIEKSRCGVLISNSKCSSIFSGNIDKIINIDQIDFSKVEMDEEFEEINACILNFFYSNDVSRLVSVEITHDNIINSSLSTFNSLELDNEDSICLVEKDLKRVFVSLLNGMTLIIPSNNVLNDSTKLLDFMIDNKVKSMEIGVKKLANLIGEKVCDSLKHLIVIDDDFEFLDSFLENKFIKSIENVHLLMCNNPETCGPCFYKKLNKNQLNKTSMGKIIQNYTCYIFNENLLPTPVKVEGMLFIGGKSVVHDYNNDENLTDEKIVVNPYQKKSRLFKTDLICRYLPNSEIQFIRREGDNIVIKGISLNVKRIEKRLKTITRSEVVVTKCLYEAKLIAFIKSKRFTKFDLITKLLNMFPPYMIPDYFISVDEIPKNSRGLVDYSELLKLSVIDKKIAGLNELENTILDIWGNILPDGTSITVDDNFFHIGGSSLLLLQLFSDVEKIFQIKFPLMLFLQKPTIRDLSNLIVDADRKVTDDILVDLKDGRLPSLFLIHSGHGLSAIQFEKLARELKMENSIYAIDNPRFGSNRSFKSIDEMAEEYTKAILSKQPLDIKCPYFIGGYCLGGIISIEIAKKITLKGGIVSVVIMISSSNPQFVKELMESCENPEDTGRIVYDGLVEKLITKNGIQSSKLSKAIKMELKNSDEIEENYYPSLYKGNVVLLTPVLKDSYEENLPESFFKDKSLGWSKFYPCLNVIEIQGTHLTLFSNLNSCKLVGEQITKVLEEPENPYLSCKMEVGEKMYVKNSAKIGENQLGSYAKVDIKKGDTVYEFVINKTITEEEWDKNPDVDSFIVSHSVQIDKGIFLVPSGYKLGFYVNHNCNPNLYIKIETNPRSLSFVALLDIKKDAELFFDYSTNMASNNTQDVSIFTCSCGSKQCRGEIKDFRYLEKKYQNYYIERNAAPQFVIDSLSWNK